MYSYITQWCASWRASWPKDARLEALPRAFEMKELEQHLDSSKKKQIQKIKMKALSLGVNSSKFKQLERTNYLLNVP